MVNFEHVIAGCGKLLEKYRFSENGITSYGERQVFVFTVFLLKLGKTDLKYNKNNSYIQIRCPCGGGGTNDEELYRGTQ